MKEQFLSFHSGSEEKWFLRVEKQVSSALWFPQLTVLREYPGGSTERVNPGGAWQIPQVEEMELNVQGDWGRVGAPGESTRKESHTGVSIVLISTCVWGSYLRREKEPPKGLWRTALGPILIFLCPQPPPLPLQHTLREFLGRWSFLSIFSFQDLCLL